MRRCSVCKCWRSRLYRCVICDARLCGCCSFRPTGQHPSVRFCCYPSDPNCGDEYRKRSRAETPEMAPEDKKAAAEALGFASVEEMDQHAAYLDEQKRIDEKIRQAVEESNTTGVIDLTKIYAD